MPRRLCVAWDAGGGGARVGAGPTRLPVRVKVRKVGCLLILCFVYLYDVACCGCECVSYVHFGRARASAQIHCCQFSGKFQLCLGKE